VNVRPHKIVIVDDDIAARLALRAALEQLGFDVLQADSGVRVLAMLLIEEPDVVVFNTRMRLLDTFEVCRVLRESTQLTRTRVIFTGDSPTREELQQTMEVGADGFFPRPLELQALTAHLHMVLGDPPRPAISVAA
jgi:DNA-binding response OmpR family regulator